MVDRGTYWDPPAYEEVCLGCIDVPTKLVKAWHEMAVASEDVSEAMSLEAFAATDNCYALADAWEYERQERSRRLRPYNPDTDDYDPFADC
jgi:hypothetical protein